MGSFFTQLLEQLEKEGLSSRELEMAKELINKLPKYGYTELPKGDIAILALMSFPGVSRPVVDVILKAGVCTAYLLGVHQIS